MEMVSQKEMAHDTSYLLPEGVSISGKHGESCHKECNKVHKLSGNHLLSQSKLSYCGSQLSMSGSPPKGMRNSYDSNTSKDHSFRKASKKQMEKALNYQFKLQDVNKYYKDMSASDMNFKFTKSSLGQDILDLESRQKRLFQHSYLNKLLKDMKQSDWSESPIYHQYRRNGYLKHEDTAIFSEIELKYLHSTLHNMSNKKNEKEFTQTDGKKIVNKNFKKLLMTLEFLMNQFNMTYYFEKVKSIFMSSKNKPDMNQLNKLIQRCLKLY